MLTNVVAPDKLGGLERYVRELSTALARAGVTVTVVAKTAGDAAVGVERTDDGITVVRYRPPSKRNPLFALLYPLVVSRAVSRALRIAAAADDDEPVLIHGHFPVPMLPLLFGRRTYVYTMHAPVFRELLGERQGTYALPRPLGALAVRALAAVEGRIARRADLLITLSEFVRREALALARGPVTSRRIPGGLDTAFFSPGARTDHAGAPILFTARRLVERTGVELLVRAMPEIVAGAPGAHLYVAGTGARREAIEALIAELGLEAKVTLLGFVPEEELRSWYRSTDISVTPTLYLEGFGLSTAEAMSCGTPVVVTPAGANPEVAASAPGHPVAAETSPSALARAVLDTWVAVQEGVDADAVRALIHPAMSWDAVAREHIQAYHAVRAGAPYDHRSASRE